LTVSFVCATRMGDLGRRMTAITEDTGEMP